MNASNRKVLCVAAILVALCGPGLAESPAPPAGDLGKTVAGNIIHLNTDGIELPIAYAADGTMSAELPTMAALVAGAKKMPSSDTGRWWIAEGRLCQQWTTWLEGKAHCYDFAVDGKMVQWTRDDGRKGTARIGG